MSPQERKTKAKLNKWDYIKLKRFCIVNEIMNKMKMQHTELKMIFVYNTYDKGLLFNIYKELTQFFIRKWAENLKIYFAKEDIQEVQPRYAKDFHYYSSSGKYK